MREGWGACKRERWNAAGGKRRKPCAVAFARPCRYARGLPGPGRETIAGDAPASLAPL